MQCRLGRAELRGAFLLAVLVGSMPLSTHASAQALTPSKPAGATSWPMYGLNAAHDATYVSAHPSPPVSWKFSVPRAIPLSAKLDAVKSQYVNITAVRDLVGIPVGVSVVDGVVYVPCDDGFLYALSAVDGKLLWKFSARNQIMTTPVVADTAQSKMVYVGGGNSDFTYSEAVKFAKPGTEVTRGTGISGIYALNAKSGKLVWAFHTRGEDMPTPVFYRGKIVFGNGDGNIYGLNAETGKLLWKVPISSFVSMSSATLSNNLVIMAGTHPNNMYAVDADTGTLAWKTPLGAYSSSAGDCAPAASGGIVVSQIEVSAAAKGQVASEEVGIDAVSGKILWRTTLGVGPVPPRNKDAVPMIHDDIVYTGSPVANAAYALNLKDGKILWSKHLTRMKAAPSVQGDHVFFPLGSGSIAVLDKQSGTTVNMYRSGNGGFGPQNAVIVDQTMYIGTNFGWVYAIPTANLLKATSHR